MTLALAMFGFSLLGSFGNPGGSFTVQNDMATTYRHVLNEVKREGFTVESASPDAGIKTSVVVTGHYHQTGSYLQVQFVSDAPGSTTVNVSVIEEKRFKALQTEPWGTPHENLKRSEDAAAAIQKGLAQ